MHQNTGKPLYFQNFTGGLCPRTPSSARLMGGGGGGGGETQGPLIVKIFCKSPPPPPPASNSWTRTRMSNKQTNTGLATNAYNLL